MEPDAEPRVVTVRGCAGAHELGIVLPSELVLFDLRATHHLPPRTLAENTLRDAPIALSRLAALRSAPLCSLANLCAPAREEVEAELCALRCDAGGGAVTVVDLSLPAGGRDPAGLRALSEATGVHIVMAAGFPACPAAAGAPVTEEEEAELIAELATQVVAELTAGVDGVRAGVIATELHDASPRALRTLAAAQQRSGAPLFCALPPPSDDLGSDERATLAALVALESHGAAMDRVVLTHAQHLLGAPVALAAIAARGVTLCFDGLGMGWAHAGARGRGHDPWSTPPPDDDIARAVSGGTLPRVLVSTGVGSRLQLASCGGGGYGHVLRSFLPRARHRGLTAEAEARISRTHAAALLAWDRPPARAPRLVTTWACATCHRSFDEAVHPSEALGTDRTYYEKYEWRYCAVACLAAHRKAGFAQPFSAPPPPE